jgi:exodeoxyribonuclease VII small subunit
VGSSKGSNRPADSEAGSSSEMAFEQILQQLQSVVERLEKGDLPLEESLAIFERGVRLSREGAKRLDEAERKVEVLLSDQGEIRTQPLIPEE